MVSRCESYRAWSAFISAEFVQYFSLLLCYPSGFEAQCRQSIGLFQFVFARLSELHVCHATIFFPFHSSEKTKRNAERILKLSKKTILILFKLNFS